VVSFQTDKGRNGELDLVKALKDAGYEKAHRSGHRQRINGPGPPDVDGTPYYAENKSRASIPLAIWKYFEECLEKQPKDDNRPILLRIKRTGRKFPALIVMTEEQWVQREKLLEQQQKEKDS
jgi:hypothetical protein